MSEPASPPPYVPAAFSPRWVATASELNALVAELRDTPRYAVDTEFMRQSAAVPAPALVQLAWSGGVALVDPQAVSLKPLAAVFEGPGVACGHALSQDLEILAQAVGVGPARVFDTQIAAAFLGHVQIGLAALVAQGLGLTLTKGPQRSDWNRRPLSPTQRSYAAADVAHLLPLCDRMCGVLAADGRLAWAEEDMERLRTEGLSRPGPAEGVAPDALIQAVRDQAAALGVPAQLLATRADLAWYDLGQPHDRLVHGWRAEALATVFAAHPPSGGGLTG